MAYAFVASEGGLGDIGDLAVVDYGGVVESLLDGLLATAQIGHWSAVLTLVPLEGGLMRPTRVVPVSALIRIRYISALGGPTWQVHLGFVGH